MRNYYNNDEIYHHGIKGQQWGVRRYQNEDGTLTSAGKARYYNEGAETAASYLADRTANSYFKTNRYTGQRQRYIRVNQGGEATWKDAMMHATLTQQNIGSKEFNKGFKDGVDAVEKAWKNKTDLNKEERKNMARVASAYGGSTGAIIGSTIGAALTDSGVGTVGGAVAGGVALGCISYVVGKHKNYKRYVERTKEKTMASVRDARNVMKR